MIARQETVEVNGQEFTLQSVSPRWYIETNDRCGITGTGSQRDTARYMDLMLKNVVIAPAAVAANGYRYFDDLGDIETPEMLMREIELFLRPGKRASRSQAAREA